MPCRCPYSLFRQALILLLGLAFFSLLAGQLCWADQGFGILLGDDQDNAQVRETSEKLVEALKKFRELNSTLVDHRTLPIAVYHYNIPKHREVFSYFDIKKGDLPFAGIALFQDYVPTKILARYPVITDPSRDAERIFEKCREVTGKPLILTVKAKLRILSSPSDADVIVSGRSLGRTPVELQDLDPGTLEISIRKEGYSAKRETLKLSPGESREVSLALDPALGALSVSSDPPGARVLLDGEDVGVTPLVVKGLQPGIHRIKMTCENCRDHSGEMRISGDKTDSFHVALVPVRARLFLEVKKKNLYEIDKYSTRNIEISRSALEKEVLRHIAESKAAEVVSDRSTADFLLSYNYAAADTLVYGQIVVVDLKERTQVSEESKKIDMPSSVRAGASEEATRRASSIFGELFEKVRRLLAGRSKVGQAGPSRVTTPAEGKVKTFPEVKQAKSYDTDRYSPTLKINQQALEKEVTRRLTESGLLEVVTERSEAEILLSYSYAATDSKVFGQITIIDLKTGARLLEESKTSGAPSSRTSEEATQKVISILAQLFEKARETIGNLKK